MKKGQEQKIIWVECGRIGRPIGLRGDVAVFWLNEEGPVKAGDEIFAASAKEAVHESYKIAASQKRSRFSVVRFENINDRAAAAKLSNRILYLPEDRLAHLPEGEYYCYQILGLDVVLEDGSLLGKVVRIFTAGENDVYEICAEGAKPGNEILIPAIDSVVLSIDLSAGKIVVRPMEGMIDDGTRDSEPGTRTGKNYTQK